MVFSLSGCCSGFYKPTKGAAENQPAPLAFHHAPFSHGRRLSYSSKSLNLVIIAPAGGTIIITPASADGTSVAVTINGKSQKVPVASSTLGHILVYGQSGNDVIKELAALVNHKTVFVAIPAVIFAGSGANTVSVAGSAANNVLMGGGGSDTFTGGSGRDILIGGAGPAFLHAGSGGDILIAGRTIFDANLNALLALMAEWGRADLGPQARGQNLFGETAGGANGAFLLVSASVIPTTAISHLFGGAGADWFWLNVHDELNQYTSGEAVTSE
jgi:Ca2+-binding RTX toxin-like protein